MRFLLGVAEAGLYPGILLYFTYWFPAATRARIMALFCMGIPVSNIIGSPLSGWLLGLKPAACMAGNGCICWKAFPPCCWALSCCVAAGQSGQGHMADGARESRSCWRGWLPIPRREVHGLGEMLRDWRVWALIVPDFTIVFGIYALGLWMPQMVQAMGYSINQTSFIVIIPYTCFAGDPVAVSAVSSDRSGKRVLHFCLSALLARLGFAIAALGRATR